MIVVEVQDIGLRVFRAGRLEVDSPAFVHLDRRAVEIGADAAGRRKLDPARTEHEFWHRFGRDELRRRHRQARYQADLAYLHLEHVWGRVGETADPVALVVASDFRTDQLALLLGMAQRLAMPVRAVVDAAIAGCAQPRPGRRLLHLDIHLHRAVLTALSQGEILAVERASATPEAGWLRVLDAWADAVARVFVQGTRFDPMHEAVTEQRLHDQLAGWADALRTADEVAVSLTDRGRRFDARLGRSAIVAAAAPVYRRLAEFVREALPEDAPATLLLTHRAEHLPGLVEVLRELPHLEVVRLEDEAVAAGVAGLALPQADGEEVPVVREKPWWARSTQGEHARALDEFVRRAPTHWVTAGLARPLGARLAVGADGAPGADDAAAVLTLAPSNGRLRAVAPDGGVTVNGRPLPPAGQLVAAGDRLRHDRSGFDALLIAVDDDGP